MNSVTINLSSSDTEYDYTYSQFDFDDYTELALDPTLLIENYVPTYLKIDWGDGTIETFDNDIYDVRRQNVNLFKTSSVLRETYRHRYTPGSTLYKSLTAQVFLNYTDGGNTWIKIPIRIRSYGYFESIYDLDLRNTNIVPLSTNIKQHQFISEATRHTLELRG